MEKVNAPVRHSYVFERAVVYLTCIDPSTQWWPFCPSDCELSPLGMLYSLGRLINQRRLKRSLGCACCLIALARAAFRSNVGDEASPIRFLWPEWQAASNKR